MIKKNMDEAKKGFIKQLGGIAFKKVSENTYEFSGEVKEGEHGCEADRFC